MDTQFIIEAVALMGVCFATYKFYQLSQTVSELEEDLRDLKIMTHDRIKELEETNDCIITDIDNLILKTSKKK